MEVIKLIYNMYESLFKVINLQTSAGKRLCKYAIANLGLDVAPLNNEFGCAEAVNNIVFEAFGDYAGGDVSTYRMYHSIKNNKKFIRVTKPLAGDIILSPTGFGNGNLSNGHVGIVSYGYSILSNDSVTGKWMPNYTFKSWKKRYGDKGGFPICYYRRISI